MCRLPVVRGVADEERLAGRRTGFVEDLLYAFRLRLRRTVDPDEVLCEVPAAGDLLHLGLRGCGDDVEREPPGADSEEFLRSLDVWDGEHCIKGQPGVLGCEPLLLLGSQFLVEDVCVDVAELVVAGHPTVIEVECDDLVELLWGRKGEDLPERRGLHGDGLDDDAVEVEDEGGEAVAGHSTIPLHDLKSWLEIVRYRFGCFPEISISLVVAYEEPQRIVDLSGYEIRYRVEIYLMGEGTPRTVELLNRQIADPA